MEMVFAGCCIGNMRLAVETMEGYIARTGIVCRLVIIRYANIETLEEGYGINLLPRQARLQPVVF